MTQTLIPTSAPTTVTPAEIIAAAYAARDIPVTGGADNGIGGRFAAFGGLVKLTHEIRVGDPRGAWLLGATRSVTYIRPSSVKRVLARMIAEDREIFAVEVVHGALGGTTKI